MKKSYKDINGWFVFENFYSTTVFEFLKDGMTIVEVGIFDGKSTCFLADYIKTHSLKIKFYAVDIWTMDEEYNRFIQNAIDCEILDVITPIRLSSEQAAATFKDEMFEFIFIDASHEHDDVQKDLNAWFPKLKFGGLMGGDDYDPCWPGVIKAVDEKFGTLAKKQWPVWFVYKPYFDYFQSAFYINLASRTDRRESFEQRIQSLGLYVPRFEALILEENDQNITDKLRTDAHYRQKIGCTLSHMAVIRLAKTKQWDNIMIFEDDCVFNENFIQKMFHCISELKTISWDMFYMGGEPNVPCLPLTENLRICSETGGMYGTHAYAVNHTFYDKILALRPYDLSSVDCLYLHLTSRVYVLSKDMLATQDDTSVSDLWGCVMKRTPQYHLAYDRYIK